MGKSIIKNIWKLITIILVFAFMFLLIGFTYSFRENISNALTISNSLKDEQIFNETKKSKISEYEQQIKYVRGFEDKDISDIKLLNDFNGEKYVVIETVPKGYMIYDYEFDILLEFSADSMSPYKNSQGNLIYGGPSYYYQQNPKVKNTASSFYVNDLLSNSNYGIDNITFSKFSEYNSNFFEMLKNEASKKKISSLEAMPRGGPVNDDLYIDNYTYITNITDFAYNTNGTCGYVAGCLVLYYAYKQYDTRFIDSQFITNNGFTKGLHDLLVNIGQNLGFGNSTWADPIRGIMSTYTKPRVPEATHYSMVLSTPTNFDLCFKNNKPAIMFGNFVDPSSSSGANVNHALTAFGRTVTHYSPNNSDRFYHVNYGWKNYPNVSIKDNLFENPIGSFYNMNPRG